VTDARILEALGIPADATEAGIAEGLRRLAGLPSNGGDPALWMRVIAGVDAAVRHRDERVDLALFAHGIASHAIAPDDGRFGAGAWDAELGVVDDEADERLRELAIEQLAPRLWDAGLVYIIDYV
jgi:hypothetical protein